MPSGIKNPHGNAEHPNTRMMAANLRRLILFARFPVAGKVKTRLIPALGAEGAAALHRRLVLRTLRTAHALCQARGVELEIRFTGSSADAMRHWLGDRWLCRSQGEGDLGQRLERAFADGFQEGSEASVIIGSDCPALTPGAVGSAFDSLQANPVVFGPAKDGGYYLIGLTRATPALFRGIAWGTGAVLTQSIAILARDHSRPALLEPLDDIDRPEDLLKWNRIVEGEEADLSLVSVVIPALNEAGGIGASLKSVKSESPHEIIVVDGGSGDTTGEIAQKAGALLVQSQPGRARQMNAGAALATGNVLLFLHADTLLCEGWARVVNESLGLKGVAAGAFRFEIDEGFRGKVILEWITNIRSQWLQFPYGDQGLFLKRSLFEELGGFADLPIMDDYDLVRRLRRIGRVITVSEPARTSGRRWKRLGLVRSTLINRLVIVGYRLGVPPHKLAKLYHRRSAGR